MMADDKIRNPFSALDLLLEGKSAEEIKGRLDIRLSQISITQFQYCLLGAANALSHCKAHTDLIGRVLEVEEYVHQVEAEHELSA